MKRVVVLLSGVSAAGGVQRYNQALCMALHESVERIASIDVVSLHDSPGWHDDRLLSKPIIGSGGRRSQFVRSALLALSRRPHAVIVGHVDLSPLVAVSPALYRRRVMTIVHGVEVWRRLPFFKRLPLNRSEVIWSGSRYTANEVERLQGTPKQRLHVVHPPLHPDFEALPFRLPTRRPSHHVLTIARLDASARAKGIDGVIRAVAAIRQTLPTIEFTIVGEGNDRQRLEELSRELNLESNVHFAGQVSDDALQEYISACDIFVMPSSQEGFGMVYGEAMAYGKPVVAGAAAGATEAVIDGYTGILVTPGDLNGLVRAINTLLTDPTLAATMGTAARRWVESNLTYSAFRLAVETVMQRLIRV